MIYNSNWLNHVFSHRAVEISIGSGVSCQQHMENRPSRRLQTVPSYDLSTCKIKTNGIVTLLEIEFVLSKLPSD